MKKLTALYIFLFIANISYSQNKAVIDSINSIPFEIKIEKASILDIVFMKNAQDAHKIKYRLGEAESYINLSLVYYFQGKYESELQYSLKAITILEEIKAYEKLASQYGEMGYRMKKRNMQKALYYMQKGKHIAEGNNFRNPLLSIYNNYGVLKEMQEQYDSALYFYKKGLVIKEKINDSTGIPYSLNNIAGIYIKYKRFNEADKLYQKALKIRLALKDQIGITENYSYYGDLYYAKKEYQPAINFYKKSLEKAIKFGYTDMIQYNYKMLSENYELLGNKNEALKNYKKFDQYKDSLLNKDINSKIAELEIKFETNKKEKLLAENKNKLLEKEIEVKRSGYIQIAISFLAFFIALIGYLIYRQQKLKNSQQEKEFQLKTAIAQIETQNKLQEQRLGISRDLHDNIGAQLTFIISSVDNVKYGFNLQNNTLSKKLDSISDFTKSTIIELRDTIWAMNNNQITFEDLRARIFNFIEKAKIATENIHFKFNIDNNLNEVKLTSIQGINIYRTIQEAVNNTIKYADATEICINAKIIEKQIEIEITDNGKGFNIETTDKGNGLFNMQKRIEDIDGIFKIDSDSGKGTIIIIILNSENPTA